MHIRGVEGVENDSVTILKVAIHMYIHVGVKVHALDLTFCYLLSTCTYMYMDMLEHVCSSLI